nr:helix-turn-helix domain-containing protein [uncultured Brevundimonas sp.]
MNTLKGSVRHPLGDRNSVDTQPGDSYVVDCSRTDYWNIADGHDLQFNLTIPHHLMEEVAQRWYGFVPDDALWKQRLVFGSGRSAWLSLVDYAARSISAQGDRIPNPIMEKHIEELLCLELLRNWTENAGLNLEAGARHAAPRYVRDAEQMMMERAAQAPSITDIAAALGVSTRSLSEGFRRFRGITPHQFLTAHRLDGLRQALEQAEPGETVTSVAAARGYTNLSALNTSYRARFGESAGQTLRNRRLRR